MSRKDDILATIRSQPRRRTRAIGIGLGLVIVIAAMALLMVRGGGGTEAAASTAGPTSADSTGAAGGTGVVAHVPFSTSSTFSWSPDSTHLLVSSAAESRVYDRNGRLISQFSGPEGWLDAGRLIRGDGSVASFNSSSPPAQSAPAGSASAPSVSGSPLSPLASASASSAPASASNGLAVFANGAGVAAIVVAPASGPCADPTVNWYRNGRYSKSNDKVTPFGWSPDGKLALLGHAACTGSDASAGWKGTVSVTDATGTNVLASIPEVRGEMAFSPDFSEVAAQSDADLKLLDLAGQPPALDSMPGLRFLGWLDVESMFAAGGSQVEFVDLDPPNIAPAPNGDWKAISPTGLHIAADLSGAALRIDASDGSTLLNLSSDGLLAERYAPAGEPAQTWLQPSWWSPDGRMLVLQSTAGDSLALIAVNPARSAAT